MTTHSIRSGRQRPGQHRRQRGGARSATAAGSPTAAPSAATTAGATTHRRSAGSRHRPEVLVEVGHARPRRSRRCGPARRRSRGCRTGCRRGSTCRAPGRTCASTLSGSSASSRLNRCRRAISKDTRATSHGRRGTRQRPVDPADLEHEDPGRRRAGRPGRAGSSSRCRRRGSARRRPWPAAAARVRRRWRRPRRPPARSRTSARRPARCWPRRPGTGPAAPRR